MKHCKSWDYNGITIYQLVQEFWKIHSWWLDKPGVDVQAKAMQRQSDMQTNVFLLLEKSLCLYPACPIVRVAHVWTWITLPSEKWNMGHETSTLIKNLYVLCIVPDPQRNLQNATGYLVPPFAGIHSFGENIR